MLRPGSGTLPEGVLQTVVPAAPDAWIMALHRYSTRRFADVAADAIAVPADSFPDRRHRAFCLHDGPRRPPHPDECFRQPALARTLERMVAAEM